MKSRRHLQDSTRTALNLSGTGSVGGEDQRSSGISIERPASQSVHDYTLARGCMRIIAGLLHLFSTADDVLLHQRGGGFLIEG